MSYVTIEVEEIIAETDDALLCQIDGEEVWLPRSLVESGEDYGKGDGPVELNVAEWKAKEEGLI